MDLVHFVFMLVIVLFLVLALSSCKYSGNVELNTDGMIGDKLKGLKVPVKVDEKLDISDVKADTDDTTTYNEITGDFRFDNMFK